MRKHSIPFVSIAVLAMLLMSGCGNSREQELENQVKQLEQQISDLQNGTGSADDANDTPDDSGTDGSADDAAATDTDLDALTQKVSDAVAKADATKPSGTTEQKRSQFFEQKAALDALDREVDTCEDDAETQYRSGTLSYDEFRARDRALEKLEDSLDDAEDRLEDRFGFDDDANDMNDDTDDNTDDDTND